MYRDPHHYPQHCVETRCSGVLQSLFFIIVLFETNHPKIKIKTDRRSGNFPVWCVYYLITHEVLDVFREELLGSPNLKTCYLTWDERYMKLGERSSFSWTDNDVAKFSKPPSIDSSAPWITRCITKLK